MTAHPFGWTLPPGVTYWMLDMVTEGPPPHCEECGQTREDAEAKLCRECHMILTGTCAECSQVLNTEEDCLNVDCGRFRDRRGLEDSD